MSRFFSILVACFVLLGAGCNLSPKAAAYKTLKSVAVSVDSAMGVYGDLYRAGKVTPSQRETIKDIYVRYQSSMAVAIAAARMDYTAPASSDLVTLAESIIATINTFKGATP